MTDDNNVIDSHDEVGAGLLSAIEAILMVLDQPATSGDFAVALEVPTGTVERALSHLREEYDGGDGHRERGFQLRKVAGGWRLYSRSAWAPVVGQFIIGSDNTQLSQAALETLSIVAYRQPVTRGQVSRIRGVNVDAVMRNLQTRGLITEDGQTNTGAYLYRTTPYFLECMGFETLDQLVPLAPFLPDNQELEEIESNLEDTHG